MKLFNLLLISILILSSCEHKVNEQNSKKKEKTEVKGLEFIGHYKSKAMILGSYHFSNPQMDDYKEEFVVDMSTEQKQKEIENVIKKLLTYAPTKILVEVPRIKGDSIINERYQKFLLGEYELPINETYQIGFRLAKKLGHKKIYASDVINSKWFGANIDWDNYNSEEYENKLGQFEKTHRYDFDKIYRESDSLKTVHTLIEHYIYLNDPKYTLTDHQSYLTNTLLTGAGDKYIGADNLARWYQRNLKVFANIYDIADFNQEEKILLIYGNGHVHLLKQFLTDSPDFEYLEVNEILK
ncbi:hypothetical protein KO566_10690 [Flavobacteriaceae bacterium XHP0103]|uniref:DUF5694 domain-containing protein n=1 Tax=Marixanthotalea marina TaxID=2844359 RepID=UPI002989B065|nr:DUF5694 domain-containing protein [Marixanthotalea marina]MBU3822531.1 hypothetical protein [Marixanthotalea marina]